jgi:hypothetical protein
MWWDGALDKDVCGRGCGVCVVWVWVGGCGMCVCGVCGHMPTLVERLANHVVGWGVG